MNLLEHLHQKLQTQPIPFVDFMQEALYARHIGYYNSNLHIFGKKGDFVTAPELTPLFGQTLANQCQQILSGLDKPCILEFGAGSGRLCIDILNHLKMLNCLPEHYFIIDVSESLKSRQQQLIQKEIPDLSVRVKWLSNWPETPFNGVILANEVLDAMPVHRFLQTKEGLLESYVDLDEKQQLKERFIACTNEQLKAHVKLILPPEYVPYLSEANLSIDEWLKHTFGLLHQGVCLIIDYGFPRHEYYHPDRSQGTLMCHYQHQSHTNPLVFPGEQDITAHVDFTHVADAALRAGFHVAGYTNQASFLLSNSLLNLPQVAQQSSAIKQLLQPEEMGELFKVIALTKQFDKILNGFQLNDKRGSL